MKNKKRNGYTLVEILVVVMIIGLLIFFSAPLYNKLVQRSYAPDALHNLEMLSGAESKNFVEHGVYTSNLSELDTPLRGNTADIVTPHFTYFAGDIPDGDFCVYAESNSRDYILARNYRNFSKVLCFGEDCSDISSLVEEGDFSEICWDN